MNNIMKCVIVSFIVLSLFGCNNEDEVKREQSIIGTWQLVEIYQSEGGPGSWSTVENGYKYTFLNNGNFSSDRFDECANGTYSIESNELILNYDCDGFTTGIETPEGVFIEKINFESGYLSIIPTYVTCVEGCDYKFKKINSSE